VGAVIEPLILQNSREFVVGKDISIIRGEGGRKGNLKEGSAVKCYR